MAGRSRMGVYRRKKKRGVSRLYFLLFLFLGFLMYRWGFQFLIKMIAKTGNPGSQVIETEDVIPPQMPVLSALPEATNSGQLKVEGYTEPNVQVKYFINDQQIIDELADESGFYQAILGLEEGENLIKVMATDEAGNESVSRPVKVIYDYKGPEIELSSPADGQEFIGQQEQTISVSGRVSESETVLRIAGTYVRLGDDGSFDSRLKLREGENEIKLVATDLAGNVTEKIVKVTYVR